MLILGFGNKSRNGKDTAAEAIRDYYDKKNQFFADIRSLGKHADGFVKTGIFKYATALYEEVNDAIAAGIWKYRQLGNPGVDVHAKPVIVLPEWVQPDPNPEVSALAPHGKHPKLLQWWGTEFRRSQDANYWVNKAFERIPANLDIAMFTDVRFPNEAEAIKQRGGYTINVQRLNKDGSQYFSSDRPVDHPSETALDGYNWDFYIKSPDGHAALTGEVAITYVEYLRELHK